MPRRDKAQIKETSRLWGVQKRLLTKEYLTRLKASPCLDCGIQYSPWIMDFDHRNPKLKVASISDLYLSKVKSNQFNSIKLDNEIAKCDLVCANCHRDRTHKRQFPAIPPKQ